MLKMDFNANCYANLCLGICAVNRDAKYSFA